jgi:predicted metal-dependent phosphoesterase TrpH
LTKRNRTSRPHTHRQKIYADLHIHSVHSDGTLTPREILETCRECGIKVFSITDHDTVSGIEETMSLVTDGIEVIPAVEMSSNIIDLDIHILGYYIDHRDPHLIRYLDAFKQHRTLRIKRIIEKLSRDGILLEFEQIKAVAHNCSLGRPHIAEVLVENGYVKSINEAFIHYLGYQSPYYEPKKNVHPRDVIKIIRACGGIPVIAHPGIINNERIVYDLIMAGAMGLEVWHPDHTSRNQQHFYEIALKNRLLMTGGSDCHGRRGSYVSIGMTGCGKTEVDLLKERKASLVRT